MRYLFPLNPYNQQRQFQKPAWVYPAHLAMYATYLRDQGHEVIWDAQPKDVKLEYKIIIDDFDIKVPFDQLPYPDRVFTDAKNPRWQSYGNYKFHPATHMMASNLCWYGKCTFCIDTAKLEAGEKRGVRSVDHCMEEIDDLIDLGYKEVFDDSGTFPVGKWLEEFCRKMKYRKDYITIGCNMKPVKLDYQMMADAGFRFILVGIESANQETIERIKKGQNNKDIVPIMKSMSDAGLDVHLTSMYGYEWESHEDNMRTVDLVYFLLKKGYIKTAQASVFMPPRTAPPENHPAQQYIKMVYDVYKQPWYWWKKITSMKDINDLTYLLKRVNHLWQAK